MTLSLGQHQGMQSYRQLNQKYCKIRFNENLSSDNHRHIQANKIHQVILYLLEDDLWAQQQHQSKV